jgi:hypothetical protein
MPKYYETITTNLSSPYFRAEQPLPISRRTTMRLYIPALNLQLCRRYRGKNAAIYLRKAAEFIDAQIAWVEKQLLAEQNALSCLLCRAEKEQSPLKWTGSVVEWVELIYALHDVKRINGGKISLKNLFRQMGEMFGFEVKEFANYFMSIKNRTDKRRTKFTDLMREAALERMTEADRKPSRK